MKIVLIGATGYVGSKILSEALERGHDVTAVVRNPDRLPKHARLTPALVDVLDTDQLAKALAGHDAVITAYNPGTAQGDEGVRSIVDAVKRAGVARLLAVGGASSLEAAPGKLVIDDPHFPEVWKAGARATTRFLDLLKKEPVLDWTFLSPAATLQPGKRTGKFRLGGDQLVTDAKGESRISVEDYAVAFIDELEKPAHRRQRFTVGY